MSELLKEAQRVMAEAECLYDRTTVETACDQMASHINRDMVGTDALVLCILNGGLVAAGLLLPRLDFPLRVDYLHATRYRERTAGDDLHWRVEPSGELLGKDVLLIDDILDEGYTLDAIIRYCEARSAASVRAAVLVEKHHDRGVAPPVDYIGLTVPDRYVFGFGMDYKGYWRNAPGIYAVME